MLLSITLDSVERLCIVLDRVFYDVRIDVSHNESYGPDKLRWEEVEKAEEAEAEEKNQTKTICLPSFEGET
jgi:hypothetical protein